MATLDEFGREVLDDTPIAFPVGFQRPEPLHVRIRRMVEQYHREMQESEEYETFADADDFDVEDGIPSWEDSPSAYEIDFMPSEMLNLNSKPEQATPAPVQEEPPKAESSSSEQPSK